jgi:hypothetical protein
MAQNHSYSRDHPSILSSVNSMSATLASSVAARCNALFPLTLGRSANAIELLVPIAPAVHNATDLKARAFDFLSDPLCQHADYKSIVQDAKLLSVRIRVIHLYEADYNLFLKIQWGSRLVKHGEKHKKGLNDQNFGSRKSRTAMEPVLLRHLSYDLSRQSRTNLATFDNDASACYDRIIVALAMLAARRLRMPRNAV